MPIIDLLCLICRGVRHGVGLIRDFRFYWLAVANGMEQAEGQSVVLEVGDLLLQVI